MTDGPYEASTSILDAVYQVTAANLPGLGTLFVLSVVFSTINFYAALRDHGVGLDASFRYLFGWVLVNFLLSLLILLLILPPNMTLDHVDRTILVYCVLATALPEIATNIKVQLGDTSRGIDLYKYKKQVSQLILDRAGTTGSLRQALRFQNLAFYYHDRTSRLEERITSFAQQERLTEGERAALEKLVQQVREHAALGTSARIFHLTPEHETLMPKLIGYFSEDIHDYLQTSEAKLMRGLRFAHVSIDEVRKLVRAGVLSPTRFFRRTKNAASRNQLAEASGLPSDRLEELYYQSLRPHRLRARSRVAMTVSSFLIVIVSAFLILQFGRKANYAPQYVAAQAIESAHPVNSSTTSGAQGEPPIEVP